jgi:hypothetical protein
MHVASRFRRIRLFGPPPDTSPPLQNLVTRPLLARQEKNERSPPAILSGQIPDSRAPSQTCPAAPLSSQGGRAPHSGSREASLGAPAGPRPRDPPSPSPLRTSLRAGHFPKDGAIAVPSWMHRNSRRAVSPNPRAVTRFGRARIVRGALRARHGPGRCCLGRETPRNENGDTGGRLAGRRQLAVRSEREAGCRLVV